MIIAEDAAIIETENSSIIFDRFLVMVTLAYIAGITGGRLWLAESLLFYWFSALLMIVSILFFLCRLISIFRIGLLLLIALSGAVSFYYYAFSPESSILQYIGNQVYIEGTVIEEPLFYEDHSDYQLRVEYVETKTGRERTSGKILVRIYDPGAASYQFGERLRIRASVVEPRGLRNPGGFDYRYYLRSQGIDALTYPYASRIDSLGPGETNLISASATKLRTRMKSFIVSTLPAPSSELLMAVIFGHKEGLPENIEDNFRKAGVGHLMAVSGLHVGLVAALILGLWRRLKLKGRLPLVIAIFLVLAYAYLTGMRPSALRAAIMISMALGALLLDREKDLSTAVAFAALITLFINPLLLFTVGFQLSYAATLALIYLYRPIDLLLKSMLLPSVLRLPFAITLAAQVGVLPLSVYYFHYLPTGALIFNLLLLPLTAFIVGFGLTGALAGLIFPFLGASLLWASRPLLELMLAVTDLSNLPGLYLALNPPGPFLLIFSYGLLGSFLTIYYRWEKNNSTGDDQSFFHYLWEKCKKFYTTRRKLAVSAILVFSAIVTIVIWVGILFPREQPLTITFIDVGQGASALVEAPCGAVILIDAGGEPAYKNDPGAVGEKVVLPFLRYKGVNKIDLAIITHPHEDHFGGFIPLLDAICINQLLLSPVSGESCYYTDLLEKAKNGGTEIITGYTGQSWNCGSGLQIDILGPPAELIRNTGSELNNNSLVIMLKYETNVALFTGDIEDLAVQELLINKPELEAMLLQIPHHGGYLAAIDELLDSVQPELAVIQVGANTFGHPHPFVIEALEEAGIQTYRTDQHGAIIFKTDGRGLEVSTVGKPAD
jgi:competence protein ComEC